MVSEPQRLPFNALLGFLFQRVCPYTLRWQCGETLVMWTFILNIVSSVSSSVSFFKSTLGCSRKGQKKQWA